jgi:hypothetical protein
MTLTIVHNEMGRMKKEAIMAKHEIQPLNFLDGQMRTTKISVRICGVRTDIREGMRNFKNALSQPRFRGVRKIAKSDY